MRKYFGLWSILAVAFVVFFGASAFGDVDIDFTLRGSGMFTAVTGNDSIADSFFGNSADSDAAEPADNTSANPADASEAAPEPEPAEPPVEVVRPTTPDGKVILFIGDSMLEGLSPRLAAYAKENGHSLYSVIWYSSTSEIWGETTKVKEFINK